MQKMIFYAPDYIPDSYLQGLDLYLWIFSIVILIVGFFLFIQRSKQPDLLESTKQMYIAFTLFCFFMGINKITFILSYKTPYYSELLGIGYISAALSLMYMLYVFEKYVVTKTRFIFTILSIFTAIFMSFVIFLPDLHSEIRDTGSSASFLVPILIMFVWAYLIKHSVGEIRKKALMSFIGYLLIYAGYLMDSEVLISMNIVPDIIAPIFFCSGLLMVFFYQLKKE